MLTKRELGRLLRADLSVGTEGFRDRLLAQCLEAMRDDGSVTGSGTATAPAAPEGEPRGEGRAMA